MSKHALYDFTSRHDPMLPAPSSACFACFSHSFMRLHFACSRDSIPCKLIGFLISPPLATGTRLDSDAVSEADGESQ